MTGAWGSSVSSPYTVYIVGESSSSNGANQRWLNNVTGVGDGSILLYQGNAAPNVFGTTAITAATGNMLYGVPVVMCNVVNGASHALYENDASNVIGTGTNSTTLTGVCIGNNFAQNAGLRGKIATILIYSGAHDAATRALIMGWLADRYGFNRSLTPYLVGGLAYWLDPDRYADGSGPGAWTMNSTKVATAVSRHAWNGVADTNKNVTQATDGNRPTINVADSAFGGRNTLSFSYAAAQLLRSATLTAAIAAPQTVYAVALSTGTTADIHRITNFDAVGTTNKGTLYQAITTGLGVARGSTNLVNSTTNVSDGVARVYCGVFNGASSGLYLSNATTGWTGTTGSDSFDSISIGGLVSSQTWDGKIATVLVYSGVHTTAQRQLIMGYLGARYGITVTP
jgi:hypothetical protein